MFTSSSFRGRRPEAPRERGGPGAATTAAATGRRPPRGARRGAPLLLLAALGLGAGRGCGGQATPPAPASAPAGGAGVLVPAEASTPTPTPTGTKVEHVLAPQYAGCWRKRRDTLRGLEVVTRGTKAEPLTLAACEAAALARDRPVFAVAGKRCYAGAALPAPAPLASDRRCKKKCNLATLADGLCGGKGGVSVFRVREAGEERLGTGSLPAGVPSFCRPSIPVQGRGATGAAASRIVNGFDANTCVPHFVDLNGCGGVAISPIHVLTAAHCDMSVGARVWAGVNDGAGRGSTGCCNPGGAVEEARIVQVDDHPDWQKFSKSSMEGDLAVLTVDPPFRGGSMGVGLCPRAEPLEPGAEVLAVGFGSTRNDGVGYSDRLQYAPQTILPPSSCPYWEYYTDIEEPYEKNFYCVAENPGRHGDGTTPEPWLGGSAYPDDYRFICYGDSGAPLLYTKDDGTVEVVGIVSWGYFLEARPGGAECGLFPESFVNVASYSGWLAGFLADSANNNCPGL